MKKQVETLSSPQKILHNLKEFIMLCVEKEAMQVIIDDHKVITREIQPYM